MAFNDFVRKHVLKNEATSNIKIQNFLTSLTLNDVGIYLGDGPFKIGIRVVYLHPFQGTHWVLYVHECCFVIYGITTLNRLSKFIIKGKAHCFYCEYKL